MIKSTVEHLCCPKRKGNKVCQGSLRAEGDSKGYELVYGHLICEKCKSKFPIFEGVAILVPEVNDYILGHTKGISKFVSDSHIPKEILKTYKQIKKEIAEEHIEEDLESDRVTALYLMNHYLKASDLKTLTSPYLKTLVEQYWNHGPMETVSAWIEPKASVLELGCGVGGLFRRTKAKKYLGVDGSFQSILLARHLNLGTSYPGDLKMPGDLFHGALTEKLPISFDRKLNSSDQSCDFVVGDLDSIPVRDESFGTTVTMNAIDMLDDPSALPKAQKRITKVGGQIIQCAPYIWASKVSAKLRKSAPKEIQDSAHAVEWLYKKEGMTIEKSAKSIPWLFYKHSRQIELYDVHAFLAHRS